MQGLISTLTCALPGRAGRSSAFPTLAPFWLADTKLVCGGNSRLKRCINSYCRWSGLTASCAHAPNTPPPPQCGSTQSAPITDNHKQPRQAHILPNLQNDVLLYINYSSQHVQQTGCKVAASCATEQTWSWAVHDNALS